ncbi:MAG: 3-oxoacyl-ACP synthase III [Planctomycetales bacterium]|nr:3-oxoacyl-ACP synthase III [Planctomycetales bacterium]
MRYQQVCIESMGYSLPEEIVTSEQLEQRLEPLYERLRLPEGRLELMTGIRERRLWPAHQLPSQQSIISGTMALKAAELDPSELGALIHGSVCRDHLEPATACKVHQHLKLPAKCVIYDCSNACLGLLNGMVQVGNMIELGQIKAGLVVGTEDSRHLMEATIDHLNQATSLTRNDIKQAIASLTIGSGSCAILLTHESISRTKNRLECAVARANTAFSNLCQSGSDDAVGHGMRPLMHTDSEALMREGIATGVETFGSFLTDWGIDRTRLNRTVCHQVGTTHRRLMLESLELEMSNDFATLEWLGNTGSVALPISWAIACEDGFINPNQRIGLLGIGSGINCLMLGCDWQESRIQSTSITRPRFEPTNVAAPN